MQYILEFVKGSVSFFLGHILFFNLVFAVIIVFFERKNPKSVWAWLLLLFFIPVAGFVFYLLAGTNLHKRKLFRCKEVQDAVHETVRVQEQVLKTADTEKLEEPISSYADLMLYNMKAADAFLTVDNDIDIYTDGNLLFENMLKDIEQASSFVHMQFYIIREDVLFEQFVRLLEKKAAQGVEVRILFDAMGCRSVKQKFWKRLREAGIETAEFFPAFFRRFHFRMNYRNHRKIVVIDNKVAYIGGFNIGREYVGLDEKFGYWRDTHLRIIGGSVWNLQFRFLLDWNYAAGQNLMENNRYYDSVIKGERDYCKVQIITGGPDKKEPIIRNNYLRLIHKAKKSIYIQTPYFIPDEAILDSLILALHSGIEVSVMIPCKPDHMFVYWATYSYIGDLVMAGAKCYTYDNGFMHAKGMIIDGQVFCYGTANMDIRSFLLNFEVNAVVYDVRKAEEMEAYFRQDIPVSTLITKDDYVARSLKIRVKEQICRLLSPLL